MKKLSSMLLTFVLLGNTTCAAASLSAANSQHTTLSTIQWHTNYDEAAELAKTKSVPLVLFFTGSDWCTWCTKLEKEALDTKEFARLVGDKFVFVKLDFPMNRAGDSRFQSQNQQLKKKYSVTGFPSLVIVDPIGQRIGTTGYRPGGAQPYADHLLSMADSYQKHQNTLQELVGQKGSIETATAFNDVKKLFLKAREQGQTKQTDALLEKGLKVDQENFFLLEQYRSQIGDGKINTKEAIHLRDKLLKSSPELAQKVNRDVAIVEFQVLQQQMKKQKLTPEAVVTPLIHYLEKFGAQDSEVWRVKMSIAQTYVEAGLPDDALRYAEDAVQNAPANVKEDIVNAIKFIQKSVKT